MTDPREAPTGEEHLAATSAGRASRKRKPTPRRGDIVLAQDSWYEVGEKQGQRIRGRLLAGSRATHWFTTRDVTRVFRELGRRA